MSSVAIYINSNISKTGKRQKEIAREAGFTSPNVLSMIKTGEMKLPLARVPALAKAMEVPAQELLRLVLRQDYPEVWSVISEVMPGILMTSELLDLVRLIRAVASRASTGGALS